MVGGGDTPSRPLLARAAAVWPTGAEGVFKPGRTAFSQTPCARAGGYGPPRDRWLPRARSFPRRELCPRAGTLLRRGSFHFTPASRPAGFVVGGGGGSCIEPALRRWPPTDVQRAPESKRAWRPGERVAVPRARTLRRARRVWPRAAAQSRISFHGRRSKPKEAKTAAGLAPPREANNTFGAGPKDTVLSNHKITFSLCHHSRL